jgi:hypothetical protein
LLLLLFGGKQQQQQLFACYGVASNLQRVTPRPKHGHADCVTELAMNPSINLWRHEAGDFHVLRQLYYPCDVEIISPRYFNLHVENVQHV